MKRNRRWVRGVISWLLTLTILFSPMQGVVYGADDISELVTETTAEAEIETDGSAVEGESIQEENFSEEDAQAVLEESTEGGISESEPATESTEASDSQTESAEDMEPVPEETTEADPVTEESETEQESEPESEGQTEAETATIPEEAETFVDMVSLLPEEITAENYESSMSLFGQCFDLYNSLSESNKALPEVQFAYDELNRKLASTYETQTLEVGYYTDHNVIMQMPQGYMGVSDWGWCRYRTVNGDVAYCIEPEVGVEGQGSQYPMSSGSAPNIELTDYEKRALCYVLYYGYDRRDVPENWQTSFGVGNQAAVDRNMAISHPEDLCYYAATQVILWAVIRGYPLTSANRDAIREVTNNCWGAHMFTTAQIGSMQSVYYEYFNTVWNNAMNAMNTTIPSFAASTGFAYPTHTLKYNPSTGTYQITLTDTNGVVNSVYKSYTGEGSGVSISRSGNSITISSASAISGTKLVTSTPASGTSQAQVPTAKLIYWTWTSENWQKFASYGSPTTEAIKAYFYLKSEQPGYIQVTKKAGDTGGVLSGAVFGVYSDQACTKQVATMTTGTNGVATSTALGPTTYYVKEVQAPSGYALNTAVHAASIGSGATVTLTVTDSLAFKSILLTKRIKAADIHFDHGEPTFIFKVTGTDFQGGSHVYYRYVVFTEDYVKGNTASDGYVSLSVTITGILAGQYTASEMEVSRYSLSQITDVSGGSAGANAVEFNLNSHAQGSAVFINEKYEEGYFSHCDVEENIFG